MNGEVRLVGGPADVGNARHHWRERRGLLVELRDGGLLGVGEASPLPGHGQGTIEQLEIEVRELLARSADLDRASPMARFAIETAMLDLAAQQQSTSVAALLCGSAPVEILASELLGDPRDKRAPSAGVRCVKLKVGPAAAWPAQRAALDTFVETHPGLLLRLDFNGTLDATEAAGILEVIAGSPWPVDYVEDPVIDVGCLHTSLDIAIDALLATPGGRRETLDLARRGEIQVAVLKPALIGGLRCTYDLAVALARAGVAPIISHLLDGPTALAACAELACAVATTTGSRRAAGVGLHAGLLAYGDVRVPQLVGGSLRPRVGGLGVGR